MMYCKEAPVIIFRSSLDVALSLAYMLELLPSSSLGQLKSPPSNYCFRGELRGLEKLQLCTFFSREAYMLMSLIHSNAHEPSDKKSVTGEFLDRFNRVTATPDWNSYPCSHLQTSRG